MKRETAWPAIRGSVVGTNNKCFRTVTSHSSPASIRPPIDCGESFPEPTGGSSKRPSRAEPANSPRPGRNNRVSQSTPRGRLRRHRSRRPGRRIGQTRDADSGGVDLRGRSPRFRNGETGAEIDVGPRIGPLPLEEMLCDSHVGFPMTTKNGTPPAVGRATRTISPKLRRFLLHRDGGTAPSTGAGPAAGSNLTTSHHEPKAVPITPTTGHSLLVSSPCSDPPQWLSDRPHLTTPTPTLPHAEPTLTALTGERPALIHRQPAKTVPPEKLR